ncbi:MAG: hypothetical protein QM504_01800 [Pseudomonadota bacterium]
MKQKSSNRVNNYSLMKGVSDTFYLAFVSILVIGGSYYIYNDINTPKSSVQISSEANKPSKTVAHGIPETIAIELKEKIITIEALKKETPVVENQQSGTEKPVLEVPVAEAAVVKETLVKETAVKEPVVEAAVVETQVADSVATSVGNDKAKTQTAPEVTATKEVATEVSVPDVVTKSPEISPQTVSEKVADKVTPALMNERMNESMHNTMYNRMPMPDMRRMAPPQYNHPMNQAAEYMPQPFMQDPYFGRNQGYRGNIEPQNYPNPNANNQPYQQQRGQYRNTNRPYPEQYTPWNPGRFY